MLSNRLFYLLMVMFLVMTACSPQVAATAEPNLASSATEVQSNPITLRLAIADAKGRTSEPNVLEFIEQVQTISNGSITIEPVWDAGADLTPVFEQGVVKAVKEGQYELGISASRAFDYDGITSFQALQAPFLITDDALAEAVAASDIGLRMLDGLSSANMTGLALWPEDLRHPFSVIADKPILTPKDFAGATVRVVPSEVTHMLIETLGGNPLFDTEDYQVAESGLRQGFSLNGTPIATGNVIFFPKFQVLFANGAAFEKLSDAQRTILLEAALETQKKAIAERPSEADAATAWCADGGTVVIASAEQVAAFEAAAQPVFDTVEQDPLNAELIAAIRELKANTEPAAGAQACDPKNPQSNAVPTAENQVWSTGLPPNGVWQVELTTEDYVQGGMLRSVAEMEWAGIQTLTLKDGKSLAVWQGLFGQTGKCQANYEVVGDIVRFTFYSDDHECEGLVNDVQWRLDEEGLLHFHYVAIDNAAAIEAKIYYETKPWQKIGDP
ncbi:MAG: hypothetical protein H7Y59_15275 [Anaerolineales bacterium]|nr:hypothetical protein [Anaerolineales bacterium]